MKKLHSYLLAAFALLLSLNATSQQKNEDPVKLSFDLKVSELYTKYKTDGFVTYKGGNLDMQRNTEFPIFVDLVEGRWYQFCVVGDPEAKKIEMKLGLEGVGDFITDKFKPEVTNEHWTQFSFVCPRSGRYLLTFYERGPKKDMMGHVAILQRPVKTSQGTVTYSMR